MGKLSFVTRAREYTFSADEDSPTKTKDEPQATVQVLKDTFFLRLLASPDLGFAEAYMFGDIDVDTEGLIDVFRVRIHLHMSLLTVMASE